MNKNISIKLRYTGNTLINNSIATIKCLAGISNLEELTKEKLLSLILNVSDEIPYSLMELNCRLKSYTMLFTKNGLLHNGNKELNKKIYMHLLKTIIDTYTETGENICEITGLRHEKTFSEIFADVLREFKVPENEIKKRDLAINRCYMPLIGGLGSDAQALPMANQMYNIHPLVIVILQFLPLSAVLYKGGILLIDSSNFEFCEEFVEDNIKKVKKQISLTPGSNTIENVANRTKGNYLLKALSIMNEAHLDYGYFDFNLWSFSNSGTGASCEIDRIPNELIKKLEILNNLPVNDLQSILLNKDVSAEFINCLEGNLNWRGLYPSKKNDGVNVVFFEKYFEIIGFNFQKESAKYIVYLIMQYKRKNFDTILKNKDAYKDDNFGNELNSILLMAIKEKKWTFIHHLNIQEDKNSMPIKYGFKQLYKIIFYYFYKNCYTEDLPKIKNENNLISQTTWWVIKLIEEDKIKRDSILNKLSNPQKYSSINLAELFIRQAEIEHIHFQKIYSILYNVEDRSRKFGLLSLLRFYSYELNATEKYKDIYQDASYPEIYYDNHYLTIESFTPTDIKEWINKIIAFKDDYLEYRFNKIEDKKQRLNYLNKIIKGIPENFDNWIFWFNDTFESFNRFRRKNELHIWKEEDILYNPMGEYRFYTFMIAFRMELSCRNII